MLLEGHKAAFFKNSPPITKLEHQIVIGENHSIIELKKMLRDKIIPFTMKSDASSYALGVVLARSEGRKKASIEYASRLFSKAGRNYSTIERDALAGR